MLVKNPTPFCSEPCFEPSTLWDFLSKGHTLDGNGDLTSGRIWGLFGKVLYKKVLPGAEALQPQLISKHPSQKGLLLEFMMIKMELVCLEKLC